VEDKCRNRICMTLTDELSSLVDRNGPQSLCVLKIASFLLEKKREKECSLHRNHE
jgi:hypothetical protein